MKAILSVNNLGYIGLNGVLPWKCSEYLKHFKKLTYGGNLLVGVNTFNELPELPGRVIIQDKRGLESVTEEWIKSDDNLWCIGGEKTFYKYMELFTEIHISYIDDNTIGDAGVPFFDNLSYQCKVFEYHFKLD